MRPSSEGKLDRGFSGDGAGFVARKRSVRFALGFGEV